MIRHILTLAVACFTAGATTAQIDPNENIKKILRLIDEELEEIDKLLMQTNRPPKTGESSGVEHMRKLVKETQGSQERVVDGIDLLIEELQQRQSSSSSSSSSEPQDDQQRQQQQQQQDQQQSQRQENERQRPPEQQGQPQQPQQSQNQQANDQQSQPQPPRNIDAGAARPGGEERHLRDADRSRWGNLPQYDLGRHSRGGLPEVPEKYRRLLEAYQKTNQRADRSR